MPFPLPFTPGVPRGGHTRGDADALEQKEKYKPGPNVGRRRVRSLHVHKGSQEHNTRSATVGGLAGKVVRAMLEREKSWGGWVPLASSHLSLFHRAWHEKKATTILSHKTQNAKRTSDRPLVRTPASHLETDHHNHTTRTSHHATPEPPQRAPTLPHRFLLETTGSRRTPPCRRIFFPSQPPRPKTRQVQNRIS